MPDVPSDPSYTRKYVGDARTPILAYNERLVRRGEFYLSLEFIDPWDELLGQMKAGKRGRLYQYSEPFIA